MNIQDAAYKTVHEYQGGSVALATRMVRYDEHGREKSMSDAVLRSKVNPNTTTHHLTLAEASEIMGLTGNYRILHALAAQHGFTLEHADTPAGGCMVTSFMVAASLKGRLSDLLQEVLKDKVVTLNESSDVAELCSDLQAVFAKLAHQARARAATEGRAAA